MTFLQTITDLQRSDLFGLEAEVAKTIFLQLHLLFYFSNDHILGSCVPVHVNDQK